MVPKRAHVDPLQEMLEDAARRAQADVEQLERDIDDYNRKRMQGTIVWVLLLMALGLGLLFGLVFLAARFYGLH